MRVEANRIELGISEGEDGVVSREAGEVEKIGEVLGTDIEGGLQPTIAKRRQECGKENCCLTVEVRGAQIEGDRVYDESSEQHVPGNIAALQVIFSCVKDASTCREREARLTKDVAKFFGNAVEAWQRADRISAPQIEVGESTAARIQADADEKIAEVRTQAIMTARGIRQREYSLLQREIEQGL